MQETLTTRIRNKKTGQGNIALAGRTRRNGPCAGRREIGDSAADGRRRGVGMNAAMKLPRLRVDPDPARPGEETGRKGVLAPLHRVTHALQLGDRLRREAG